MRTLAARPLAVLTLALSLAACAGPPPDYIQGLVPNESGFEGAVTVADEAGDDLFGYVTVNVPYLSVTGEPKMGQGRLIVRRELWGLPSEPCP